MKAQETFLSVFWFLTLVLILIFARVSSLFFIVLWINLTTNISNSTVVLLNVTDRICLYMYMM